MVDQLDHAQWSDVTRCCNCFHLPAVNPFIPTDFSLVSKNVFNMPLSPLELTLPWCYPQPQKVYSCDTLKRVVWYFEEGGVVF